MKIGTSNKTKAIMKKYNITTKKKFGQNFLTDLNTLNAIINKSSISKDDTVVEIGCGIGALTELLCESAKSVYGFEIDLSLKEHLESNLNFDNLTLIFDDFLKVDLNQYLPTTDLKVVANLPYYITTPILFKIIDSQLNFTELYVMMQKEVGNRLTAKPRTKEYNALSIMLQVNYDISTLLNVSRNVFVPVPNVDSVVIKMVKHHKYQISNNEFFSKFVHDAFQYKRKNLRNNFKEYNLDILESLLEKHGYSLRSRAEEVTVEDFVEICNEYVKMC